MKKVKYKIVSIKYYKKEAEYKKIYMTVLIYAKEI